MEVACSAAVVTFCMGLCEYRTGVGFAVVCAANGIGPLGDDQIDYQGTMITGEFVTQVGGGGESDALTCGGLPRAMAIEGRQLTPVQLDDSDGEIVEQRQKYR